MSRSFHPPSSARSARLVGRRNPKEGNSCASGKNRPIPFASDVALRNGVSGH